MKYTSLGGTACIGRVAKQQEAHVCMSNVHVMPDGRRPVSLKLPVPAAHFHSVVLPPSEVSPLTMRFVDGNGRRNLSQNRGSLNCSGPTLRRRAEEHTDFQRFMGVSCSEIVHRKNENTWLLVWPHQLEREHRQ